MIVNVIKKKRNRKKIYNEVERIQALRTSKANYQRKYRLRLKQAKEEEKATFNDVQYQADIFSSVKHLDFTHECTLRFNEFTDVEYAEKAAKYLVKRLDKGINNVIYSCEYGEDNNAHIHLAFDFSNGFSELYQDDDQISDYLHSIWNSDRVKNGAVWVGEFENKKHKENYLRYMFKQALTTSKYHYRQKQVDLYYIHSFKNTPDIKEHTINKMLKEASISSIHTKPKVTIIPPVKTIKNPIKALIRKHRHKAITMAIAAVWFLLI